MASLGEYSLGSNPPPPLKGFKALRNFRFKRRQIRRRLCVPGFRRSLERICEIIKLDVIRVLLRRVRSRMAHQSLQRDEVASAFAEETVREAMTKLMGGESTDPRSLTHAPDHSHQGLGTCRSLRILGPADTVVLRDPLFDLDREHIVIKLRLKRAKGLAETSNHVAIKGEPMPMQPLTMNTCPSADEVEVSPSAPEHLGASKSSTFHQQNRWTLPPDPRAANSLKLIEAWAINVRLSLRRPANLAGRIHGDQLLGLSPREEGMQDRNHVRPRGSASITPPSQESA